ncbi:MAG: LacI family DNA-binding transcriptional regulator [Eubacterium sp.]|nr:LacI family DNA-binding transcriptional regulator [Candidatus Colimonas fimequi]
MNIKQIAKEAGVSVATVSRVLNHPENVAPATREKIQKIIDQAEYKPNWFAQGLNFNKTKTIGIIVPHILNTMYMEIAKGVEDVALQKGYITFIGNGEMNSNAENSYLQQLEMRRVDGIVIMFTSLEEERLREIEKKGVPIVLIGENKKIEGFNIVRVDCKSGAEKMVKHLVASGHREIALLQGSDPETESMDIYEGYCNVLRENGIEVKKNLVSQVANSIEGGYLGAKKMIASENPDAIFTTSDEIAYGAMDALKDAGVRVPEDVAIAGYGNNRMSNMVEPKLTTAELPYHMMGVYGARLLFDLIEDDGKNKPEPKVITLQSKMKVRKSCGHKERIGEMF